MLADEVVTSMKAEATGREIQWQIEELPSVVCDPALVRQVFENLISNSVKYSQPRKDARIEIGHTNVNGDLVIFVRDNGVGFDMKYSDKLFGVFQRLHASRDFEGTGVGLATAARIVHKHGGRIWADAVEDVGATFYFTLAQSRSRPDRLDALSAPL
jgi:light-regulated signal transduction histidine kinase (bacteriophytochrome)